MYVTEFPPAPYYLQGGHDPIADRTGNFKRLLDFSVVAPHFAPVEWPVRAVSEQGARLEPFRPEAQ